MKDNIPIPGTSRHKLIQTGIRLFSELGYDHVEVDRVAAEAGVTIGSLYHHFKSKKGFYGIIRDDLTKRIVDRMEAAADAAPERALKAAVLAAYDGVFRIGAGKILTHPDPRGGADLIEHFLCELAFRRGVEEAGDLAAILNAALRAALQRDMASGGEDRKARNALEKVIDGI